MPPAPMIHLLPTHLVNKIAAGEVVDRPASVVKELVENSLDAGATRIDIAVEDGGRRLIQVTDDGGGMGAEDLALAFAPHATSKLAGEEDLFRIATMGFRGEALASIASISHARLRGRRREDEGGHEVEASGEQIGPVRPCAAPPGTTVAVRDLFFNTPARRKFMRTAGTELSHIVEQLARLALPYPHLAFTLTHNGREVKGLPAVESTLQRATDLFGQELAVGLIPILRRRGKAEVAGLVGTPAAARGTSRWQYFFLNGRYIRDRLLSHALREAYRGRIDPNRFPLGIIFLQVPPAEVDVNVHPTKVEVRFQDSQYVHGELLAALKETLNRAELNPQAMATPIGIPPAEGPAGPPAEDGFGEPQELPAVPAADSAQVAHAAQAAGPPAGADGQRQESLRQALADFFRSAPTPQPRLSFAEDRGAGSAGRAEPPRKPAPPAAPRRVAPEATGGELVAPRSAGDTAPPEATQRVAPPDPTAAGRSIQIHNSYIVAATEDGLVICDQHALHERILYNELRGRLAEGKLAGQRLLLPATVAVAPGEAEMIESLGELLGRLGIEAAPFGPGTVAVQQFPTLLGERGVEPAAFLREVLDRLREDETTDGERLLEDVLAMMACRAAVKAGEPMTPAEMDALLSRAREAEKGSACPHGRPTMLRMTLRDLERQFHRA